MGNSSATEKVDIDTVFVLLQHSDRRAVLGFLGANGTATVSELAGVLTDRSTEIPPSNSRKAEVRLCHIHLPKLSDANIVDYDVDSERGSLTPKGGQVDTIRRRVNEELA